MIDRQSRRLVNGFGALAHEYATALGFTFVAVGLQVVLGSFFVSLLTMRTGEQSRAMVVRFEPDRWTTTAGTWTSVTFTNADPVVHDWMVEGVPNVEAIARPGQTDTLRFVIDRPGEYPVICSVEGHAEAGMVGTLVVAAP